jgi:[NiFe] hydrogenase diaphorase moiety large subunit
MSADVKSILEKYGNDQTRLMDILHDIQGAEGYISDTAVSEIADGLNLSEADVVQTISFYHFFSQKPRGKYNIYLNDSAAANLMGRAEVAAAFESAAGCRFGEVTPDGLIGLYDTSGIGMNDQEPAAIINERLFTRLTKFRVKEIVRDMKSGKEVVDMFDQGLGDGNNNSILVQSMVLNNIRKRGIVLERNFEQGSALRKLTTMSPEFVIDEVKHSNIRGRGGAGFPTGMKWEFCRRSPGERKYVFCNADEGEPGTFKDRVILTEHPDLLIEGMTIAAYAIGSAEGIIYLRYEYKYLQKFLEAKLQEARERNFLGKAILGIRNFNFDIRIQFGAGAYVCGEETALIESAEGKRGEPRDKPPFPVEKGYLGMPTVVNNVETLCSITRIILNGGAWFREIGTKDSSGTKMLSVSGDCRFPGVYEVEWGFSVNDILEMVGGENIQAVQVGGPSGACIGPEEFGRILGYEDLATGGSMIIIGKYRDLLKDVVMNFTEFFIEESCGSCAPCRILTVVYRDKLKKIIEGKGVKQDLEDLRSWAPVSKLNRCGLGQAALNPILSTLKNFPEIYEARLQKNKFYDQGFDLNHAVRESIELTGRNAF